ncbi:MAG: DUF1294 domain-containing protein [Bacteroidales bacterium]|nr:DUF1294 domain-containing protein [Bacteroidales bacterium]
MIYTIILIAYLVFINILAFILFGVDKKHAVRHKRRIPESALLWMARLGGGIGSWIAMFVFHHKKKHTKFMVLVPLWITLWTIGIVLFIALGNGNLQEELEIVRSRFNRF